MAPAGKVQLKLRMSKSRRQDKRALEVAKSVTANLETVRNEERLGYELRCDIDLIILNLFL